MYCMNHDDAKEPLRLLDFILKGGMQLRSPVYLN